VQVTVPVRATQAKSTRVCLAERGDGGRGQKANQILSSEDNLTTTIATWNENEQKLIAVYQEKFGMNRGNAIRKMRNELKKSGLTAGELLAKGIGSKPEPKATPAKKAQPKTKKERKPKEAGDCHLNEEMKEEVTKAVRKLIGPKAAVEGIVRSSLNPKWNLYIWYGLDNGKVVSVNIGKGIRLGSMLIERRLIHKDDRRMFRTDLVRILAR